MEYHPSSPTPAPPMPVPGQIASLATTSQLGTFSRCYEAQTPLAVIGTGLLISVLAILVLGLLLLIATFLHVAFGSLALLLLMIPVLAVVYMIGGVLRSGHKVYVFRHGIIACQGSQITVLPWNQIQQIFHQQSWAVTLSSWKAEHVYRLTLHDAQSQTVELSSYIRGVKELGQIIEEAVASHLLPHEMQHYRSGNSVFFGPFSISPQGLTSTTKGQILPWHEVKSVDYVGNIITNRGNYGLRYVGVTKHDGTIWTAALETQIPNLALLFQMVREITPNSSAQ
ncbi:MAG: hypothetical protein J2P37_29105 [Ktedonobacteraceae bacterium]|nr:hypothetical protein [Ktedonobacteraceae bacterium]